MIKQTIRVEKTLGADIIPYLVQSACHYDCSLHITSGEKNINMKDGDLNINGAGFLAPGIYEIGDAQREEPAEAPMCDTFYRIAYIGEVPYEVDGIKNDDPELVAFVEGKIAERKAAKKEKNFELADAIRAELLEKGIVIEDTREGVKWKKA